MSDEATIYKTLKAFMMTEMRAREKPLAPRVSLVQQQQQALLTFFPTFISECLIFHLSGIEISGNILLVLHF